MKRRRFIETGLAAATLGTIALVWAFSENPRLKTCEERGGVRIEGTLGGCSISPAPDPRAEEILREIEEQEQRERAFGEYRGPETTNAQADAQTQSGNEP